MTASTRFGRAHRVTLWLAQTALWGVGAGVAIYLVIFGLAVNPRGVLWCTSIGAAYALMMRAAQESATRLLERRLPLRTRADVLARVLLLGATTLLSLAVATIAIEAVTGFTLFGNTSTFMLIAIVATSASIIGNGYFHLELFHARLERAEQAAVRAELQALRSQINPHFLFNSLNSIAALVRIAPLEAESVTESLADLLRYSLRAARQPTVTLGEELDALELYTTIERARFGDRLTVVVDVAEPLREMCVIGLLLQPLVENAVKHGLSRTEGSFVIAIAARLDGEMLALTVTDSGPGFPSSDLDALTDRGHGLANIRERLRLELGERATIAVAGQSVTLRIPARRDVFTTSEERHDPLHHRR